VCAYPSLARLSPSQQGEIRGDTPRWTWSFSDYFSRYELGPLFSMQPHSHPGLDPPGGADRIGADHESIEVVVADGTGGAPGGELAARKDFVDPGADRRSAVSHYQLNRKADTQAIEVVLA
jgi:hypothetical protein